MDLFQLQIGSSDIHISSSVCWSVLSEDNMKYLWAFAIYFVLSLALAEAASGLASEPLKTNTNWEEVAEPLIAVAKTIALAARTADSSEESANVAAKSPDPEQKSLIAAARSILNEAEFIPEGFADEAASNLINAARSIILVAGSSNNA